MKRLLCLLLLLTLPVLAQSVNARNLMKLGRSYAEQGEWKKVIEYAEQAMKEAPDYLDAIYLRAFAYRELKEYAKAEADFREVIRRDPQFLPTYGALAEMFIQQKQYDKADTVFSQLSQQPGGAKWASYYRGVLAYLQQQLDKAERHWKDALNFDVRFTMAQHNLGALYLAKGDHTRALTFMREAVDQKPESAMYRFHLAWVQEKLGHGAQAKKNLTDIMNNNADDQQNWLLARALHRLMEGETEQALAVLENVAKDHPTNLDVWILKGRAFKALGQPEKAREALEKAKELDPAFKEVDELLAGLPAPAKPQPRPGEEPAQPPSEEPAPSAPDQSPEE